MTALCSTRGTRRHVLEAVDCKTHMAHYLHARSSTTSSTVQHLIVRICIVLSHGKHDRFVDVSGEDLVTIIVALSHCLHGSNSVRHRHVRHPPTGSLKGPKRLTSILTPSTQILTQPQQRRPWDAANEDPPQHHGVSTASRRRAWPCKPPAKSDLAKT